MPPPGRPGAPALDISKVATRTSRLNCPKSAAATSRQTGTRGNRITRRRGKQRRTGGTSGAGGWWWWGGGGGDVK